MEIIKIENAKHIDRGHIDIEKAYKYDFIYFKCEKCGKVDSKQKKEFKEAICSLCLREETNLKKYGYNTPLKNNTIKEKIKQTNLDKYGVDNVFKNEEIKDRIRKVTLEKYGVEYYTQTNEYKEKILNKNNNKFFVETDEFKEKSAITKQKKYGNPNFVNTRKSIKTKLDKYGNNNNLEKIKQTNLERYGAESYLSILDREIDINDLKIFQQEDIIPLFTSEDYKGVDHKNKYKFKCKICNTVFEDNIDDGKIPKCPTCFPSNRSKGEIELANFLKQYIEIIENDRELIKPYEIDILIPILNLAIEYNGEYWHTDIEREKKKKLLVEDKDYSYIVIWEEQWLNNKEEIKEDLLGVIGF